MEIFGISSQALFGQLLLGLINGSFYAVLSLGLAVIFGLLNIINFSHGALYMIGAFVGAGLGHWLLGSVDWVLLGSLLLGSLPGIWLGTQLMRKTPDRVIRSLLSMLLAYAGVKLISI